MMLLLGIAPLCAQAQFNPPKEKFPEDERYIYPILPGQPGSLAGTMGELRQTHFHGGLDIRTNNQIGFAVQASGDGYISRVAMTPSGYGNVIYITHPDGHTTLYGHLDRFRGKLAEYVLNEQYKAKVGTINLTLAPDQFVVKRGDTIAWSGNSGSSGGPHLHFEFRDSNNRALNPLKYPGFTEIKDNLPPSVEKIALKTLDINARINDKFGRFEFYAQRVGNSYVISAPILAHGKIGVEILTKDKLAAGSPFFGGVNDIEMQIDGKKTFAQSIEKINLESPRSVYSIMDYKTMKLKGSRFYQLYIADGNSMEFYQGSPGDGKIQVPEGKEIKVDIILKDSYNNTTNMSFRLKYDPVAKGVPTLESMKLPVEVDLIENTYAVTAKPSPLNNKATVFVKGVASERTPDYFNSVRNVFLFDLRKEIPDSIVVAGRTIRPNIKQTIPPGSDYTYFSDPIEVQFPANANYDTLYFVADHTVNRSREIFTVGSPYIPLDKRITISIKPTGDYQNQDKYAVYRLVGASSQAYVGPGQWVNNRLEFTTAEFGQFTLLRDTDPPTIKPTVINSGHVSFKIRDMLSGIKSINASINGEWLLMHYDAKTASIWSERLDKSVPLKGAFVLEVTDNCGNTQTYKNTL